MGSYSKWLPSKPQSERLHEGLRYDSLEHVGLLKTATMVMDL